MDEVIKIPISIDEQYLKNKRFDYNIYLLMLLFSKYNPNDGYRYISEDDLIANEKMIENYNINKFETIKRNMRKLSKLKDSMIKVEIIDGKMVYIIKSAKEKYVEIEKDIIKCLTRVFKSSYIKIYLLLRYKCNENEYKIVIKKELLESIGLNCKSEKNKTLITNILKSFENINFIEKYIKRSKIINKNGNITCTNFVHIKLVPYEKIINLKDKENLYKHILTESKRSCYVYRFLDENNNILYVGKTSDIHTRMKQHFINKSTLQPYVYNKVVKVEYIICESEEDMTEKEKYFIGKYKNTIYNKLIYDYETNSDYDSIVWDNEYPIPNKETAV